MLRLSSCDRYLRYQLILARGLSIGSCYLVCEAQNCCKRSRCDWLRFLLDRGSKALIEAAETLGYPLRPLWHVVRIPCRRLGRQKAAKVALDPTEQATDPERWHPIRP